MKEENNYSSEISVDITYPKMMEKVFVNKNCSSYILPSNRQKFI